jgi:hypothetical protein
LHAEFRGLLAAAPLKVLKACPRGPRQSSVSSPRFPVRVPAIPAPLSRHDVTHAPSGLSSRARANEGPVAGAH